MSRKSLSTIVAAITLAVSAAAGAAPAAPTAVLNGATFVEYLGTTPTAVQQDGAVQWFLESQNQNFGGTTVDSWFLVFDPATQGAFGGSISFSANIVALQDSGAELAATAAFGKAGSTYDYTPVFIGLEESDTAGTTFSGSVLTIAEWTARNPGDHVRVLTLSAVPEPETGALLMAGLGVVGLLSRRRRPV